jgi:hypothetical protein
MPKERLDYPLIFYKESDSSKISYKERIKEFVAKNLRGGNHYSGVPGS